MCLFSNLNSLTLLVACVRPYLMAYDCGGFVCFVGGCFYVNSHVTTSYCYFRRALQSSPLWNSTPNELRGDISNRETWWVQVLQESFIWTFFPSSSASGTSSNKQPNSQQPHRVASCSTAGRLSYSSSDVILSLPKKGSNAGDNSLPGDLPDRSGDDGYCHEGLHRGEMLHSVCVIFLRPCRFL